MNDDPKPFASIITGAVLVSFSVAFFVIGEYQFTVILMALLAVMAIVTNTFGTVCRGVNK